MKLSELYAVIEAYAPKSLSDEYCKNYGLYDNSGILVDSKKEVKKVLFALDFSKATLDYAEKFGADAIITHHPAIYNKIGNILPETVLGDKLITAIQKGISVVSMHLNMDVTKGGIDEYLMLGIGGKDAVVCDSVKEGCAYGRAYVVKEQTLEELKTHIEREFTTTKVWAFGSGTVKKVASFCGAGVSDDTVAFAQREGADVVVSSDIKHNYLVDMLDSGLSVVQLTHYASENYGFKKIFETIKAQLPSGIQSEYFTDNALL